MLQNIPVLPNYPIPHSAPPVSRELVLLLTTQCSIQGPRRPGCMVDMMPASVGIGVSPALDYSLSAKRGK